MRTLSKKLQQQLYDLAVLHQALTEEVRLLKKMLEKTNKQPDFRYIPESKAKEMLGKGTTWFWQRRTNGELCYYKVGNEIFYAFEDIEALFEKNKQEVFNLSKS